MAPRRRRQQADRHGVDAQCNSHARRVVARPYLCYRRREVRRKIGRSRASWLCWIFRLVLLASVCWKLGTARSTSSLSRHFYVEICTCKHIPLSTSTRESIFYVKSTGSISDCKGDRESISYLKRTPIGTGRWRPNASKG